MHDRKQFTRQVLELVKRAKSSYHNSTNDTRKDVELLKKVCDELTSYRESLTLEMTKTVETMERVLRSSAQDDDLSKAFKLLESLKACFDSSSHHSMEMAKHRQQQLTAALQASLSVKFNLLRLILFHCIFNLKYLIWFTEPKRLRNC